MVTDGTVGNHYPDTNPNPSTNLTLLIVTVRSYDDKKSCLIASKLSRTAYTFSTACLYCIHDPSIITYMHT